MRAALVGVTAGLFSFSFFLFRYSSPGSTCTSPFTTEVNYVRVDMYPTSGDKPVTDLQQSEIELLEDGVPQKIVQFEHVSVSGARPQTTRPEPSTRGRDAPRDCRPACPRAGAVSRSEICRSRRLHEDQAAADRCAEQAHRRRRFDCRDDARHVGARPHLHETNGQHRADALRAVGHQGWLGTRDPLEVQYEFCYDRPNIADGPRMAREMIARRRELRTLDALDDLIMHLRGVREERKAVITVSDGWPLYEPDRDLAETAHRSRYRRPDAGPSAENWTGSADRQNHAERPERRHHDLERRCPGCRPTKCENDRVMLVGAQPLESLHHDDADGEPRERLVLPGRPGPAVFRARTRSTATARSR